MPAAAILLDDEPNHWDLLRSKVLVDMYHENDPDKILFNHLEDRTATGEELGVENIDNYYSFVACHERLKILCGLTHHMKNITCANSSKLYNGHYAPTGEYQHGFPSMEARLSRARETSLEYDIPYWYVPSSDYMRNPGQHPTAAGVKRWKSPREVRANVNMALTYGARGIVYIAFYEALIGELAETIFDNEGNLREGSYDLVTRYENGVPYSDYEIDYETLYNEFVDVNTKLDHVRNTLQTTVSLDAFHSFDLAGSLPRGLVLDYEGNRTGRQWYSPDYTEATDFLDLGTFVCPYTGVRYFAVSDRFCNWPPATYPDPTEKDVATVRHPGRVITDVYYDYEGPPYSDLYIAQYEDDHDSGVSTFEFELDNADGRVFKLDPCLVHNPGFEWAYAVEDDWSFENAGGAWSVGVDDQVARKGMFSLYMTRLAGGQDLFVVPSTTILRVAGFTVPPYDIARGATYRLSAYVKCDSDWDGPAYIRVRWLDEHNDPVGATAWTPALDDETDWAGPDGWAYTYVDFNVYVAPPGGINLRAELVLGDGTGTVWFDEVRLEPLSRVFNGHFEWDGGDWWPAPTFGWGDRLNHPGQKYWRSSPGYDGDYCLKVGAKTNGTNVVRNDEKLYLSKGTNYVVTGRAKSNVSGGSEAKVVVEFYTSKGTNFNTESYSVPAGGQWYPFTITITPEEWKEWDIPMHPNQAPPAYVRLACKVSAGSGNAYFDNIELIETNLVANGSFELAEEGPHHPDRWDYVGSVPPLPPGGPAWSALYDADAKYDRRCWRVRTPSSNINYASETFVLDPSTQYRLSGWLRNFDVTGGNTDGCYLKATVYDSYGNNLGSSTTGKVTDTEEWTYKYVDISAAGSKRFARVTVVEEEDAYSSAADGIRVLPTGILE